MSKISGINLGNPNEPFQMVGSQLGGRDVPIAINRPSANVNRDRIPLLAKHINTNLKQIRATIESLEVMGEMMVIDDDTDSVILDKNFVEDFEKSIKQLNNCFDEILKAVQQ
jgi:hypothetical protein